MSCEDCKNYEKKEDKGFQKASNKAVEDLRVYCRTTICFDCAMERKGKPCLLRHIRELLNDAGWVD